MAQAGSAHSEAGSGVVGNETKRVTLATDDPVSAALLAAVEAAATPAGGATAAKQDTIIGHLDGVETLLTAIDGRVDGVETSLTAIAGSVDGLEAFWTAPVTKTDRSGTITTGATAQQLAAANASRRGFSIQNASIGDLWFSTEATAVAASPSVKLLPGALYEEPAFGCDGGAISIIGATTGQAFAAREW